MQTENPTEEPTNGSISGTRMITMDHLCIHLSLTVQAKEAIRDICYKRINRLYTIGTIITTINYLQETVYKLNRLTEIIRDYRRVFLE